MILLDDILLGGPVLLDIDPGINGRSAISPEMAVRFSLAFGSTPEMWLRLQTAHDLAQTRVHADRINVQRYEPLQPLPRQPVLGA